MKTICLRPGIAASRRLTRSAARLAVGLLLLGSIPPLSAGPVPIGSQEGEAGSASLRIDEGAMRLSLDEAVTLAMERNLGLVVERLAQDNSDLVLKQNFGIYDVNANVNLLAWEENSPAASNLDGAQVQIQEQRRWDFGVNRLVPSGGRATIDWNNSRFETNSQFAAVNPSFRVDLDLSFSQPLLRDFGRQVTERGIRIARTGQGLSRDTFELQVMATLQQVEEAYWNLVEARAQLEVAEESRTLAEQLHAQNRIRVEVGTLAPLELVQSEAGVATRQEQIIRERALVGDSEDRLRQLLNLQQGDLWSLEIVPETDPQSEAVDIDLNQGIEAALARRPDLRSARRLQSDRELDIDYFRNQRLPRLDLAVTYGWNGLGGNVTNRDFITGEVLNSAPGDYNDAINQATDLDFEGWSVALNLAYPLQNRFGKAQAAQAEVNFDLGQAELEDLKLQIITGVRRLARLVTLARETIDSAGVSRRLQEENLNAEQKRYENGMSTSFQVLQIQEDLIEARSREVNAITGYRKALVQYYQATGELAEKSGVEIVEPSGEG